MITADELIWIPVVLLICDFIAGLFTGYVRSLRSMVEE